MPANQSWNTECKVKFNTAKDYVFTVSMTDTTPETDRTLVAYTNTANVYTPPTLTSTDIQGPYEAGVAKDFHTTVDNPLNRGKSYVNSIYYVFTIEDAVKANFISLQCYFDTTPTDILALMDEEGGNLVGRVGYDSAGFPMPAGWHSVTRCTLNAATAGTYTFTVDMVDNPSGVPANDRILTSLSAQATVTGSLDITGTFSMQGRVYRGGIPVIFTLSEDYAPSAQTTDVLGVNFNLSVDYTGTYAITTDQPRYLNLSTEINKHITVDGDMVLSPLVLRGGNVTDLGESLNKVDVSDAGVVGGDYRKTGDNPGDANFDLIVNIQDLALVGSNYGVTSATAYASWMP